MTLNYQMKSKVAGTSYRHNIAESTTNPRYYIKLVIINQVLTSNESRKPIREIFWGDLGVNDASGPIIIINYILKFSTKILISCLLYKNTVTFFKNFT